MLNTPTKLHVKSQLGFGVETSAPAGHGISDLHPPTIRSILRRPLRGFPRGRGKLIVAVCFHVNGNKKEKK